MDKPLIVICGSMAHYARMRGLEAKLAALGIAAVSPADERMDMDAAERVAFKRQVSRDYFRLIRRRTVRAILVANYPKRAKQNYIGPNAFAEIAVAFSARKPIFLLHGIHPPLADELRAWGAIPLGGKLGALVKAVKL